MQALYYVSIFAFPQVDNSKKVKKIQTTNSSSIYYCFKITNCLNYTKLRPNLNNPKFNETVKMIIVLHTNISREITLTSGT